MRTENWKVTTYDGHDKTPPNILYFHKNPSSTVRRDRGRQISVSEIWRGMGSLVGISESLL